MVGGREGEERERRKKKRERRGREAEREGEMVCIHGLKGGGNKGIALVVVTQAEGAWWRRIVVCPFALYFFNFLYMPPLCPIPSPPFYLACEGEGLCTQLVGVAHCR